MYVCMCVREYVCRYSAYGSQAGHEQQAVRVCMYVGMYVCVRMHKYLCIMYVCMRMYKHLCVMYVCMLAWRGKRGGCEGGKPVCVWPCVHVWMYSHMHMGMYVCMFSFIALCMTWCKYHVTYDSYYIWLVGHICKCVHNCVYMHIMLCSYTQILTMHSTYHMICRPYMWMHT